MRIRTSRRRRNLSLAVFYYKTDEADKYVSIAIKLPNNDMGTAMMKMEVFMVSTALKEKAMDYFTLLDDEKVQKMKKNF